MPVSSRCRRRWNALVPCLGLAFCAGGAPAQSPPPADPLQLVAPARGPTVPAPVSRPADWPRGAATAEPGTSGPVDKHVLSSVRGTLAPDATVQRADGSAAMPGEVVPAAHVGPAAEPVSLDTAQVMARVGPEVVLESDLLTPKALEFIENAAQGLSPDKVRDLRLQICRQVIDQHVETLLVFVDACREIPEDKLPEIRRNVDKAFDEQMLPNLMKEANAANSLDYERMLRAKGQSLDRMRKMFFERGLAQEWMRRNIQDEAEIPHAELIAWYQEHLADYEFPARARYEILSVKMGLKRSRREAWDMLAGMGNEVLAGRPFAEVARARSEGPTAAAGGTSDWTSQGSLASKVLDEALFALPIGQLSAILEDGELLHIVRVLEREEAGRTPFLEAQVGIRETLREERRKKALEEYLAKLRARTPVWTVFDGPETVAPAVATVPDGATATR